MKATIRIPTLDQYAFIEIHVDDPTPENVLTTYTEYSRALKGGVGMDRLDFNQVLDNYLTKEELGVEDWEEMSLDQQDIIQNIKRSKARTNK